MLPFTIAIVYLINYALIPRFLNSKNYLKLGIYIFLLLLIVPLIARIFTMWISENPINSGNPINLESLFDYNLLPFYFEIGLITFIAITIKLVRKDKDDRELKHQLEQEKMRVELFALKNQLNAHFLFNTLNNIYGLTIKKSDLAPRSVLMLSQMLNTVLYETSNQIYSLQKELEFIDNYVELERLRYGVRLDVSIEKNIEYLDVQIPPMILFPFVENSFKHGVRKTSKKSWIKMCVISSLNQLDFEISNSKISVKKDLENENGGVGLENIGRRLDLLYPSRHKLIIGEYEKSYSVKLTIRYNI
jgi:LytS/YehU family sensor histidine kinase